MLVVGSLETEETHSLLFEDFECNQGVILLISRFPDASLPPIANDIVNIVPLLKLLLGKIWRPRKINCKFLYFTSIE